MMNSKTLFHEIVKRITITEGKEEIHAIVNMIFAHKFSLSRTDIMAGRPIGDEYRAGDLDTIIARINHREPVQYIINEADFWMRKFFVDSSVLIPRPETEELVKHVISVASQRGSDIPRIADIGTGSGCIAITLALEIPQAQIYATDISKDALTIAQRNAVELGARVQFIEHDLLSGPLPFNAMDIVVSNPPYIPLEEMNRMSQNVYGFEPHTALFVPDDDPLLFYRALAASAWEILTPDGVLAVEVNERFGTEVSSLFSDKGYVDVHVHTDLSEKERIVVARKPDKHEFEVKYIS